jgi:hypothetical protein
MMLRVIDDLWADYLAIRVRRYEPSQRARVPTVLARYSRRTSLDSGVKMEIPVLKSFRLGQIGRVVRFGRVWI